MNQLPNLLEAVSIVMSKAGAQYVVLKPKYGSLSFYGGKIRELVEQPLTNKGLEDIIVWGSLDSYPLPKDLRANFKVPVAFKQNENPYYFYGTGIRTDVGPTITLKMMHNNGFSGFPGYLEGTVNPFANCKGLTVITGPKDCGKTSFLVNQACCHLQKSGASVIDFYSELPLHRGDKSNQSPFCDKYVLEPERFFTDAQYDVIAGSSPMIVASFPERDRKWWQLLLDKANTGTPVFVTVPAAKATDIPEMIISSFPKSDRRRIGEQLARCLNAIIRPNLLKSKPDDGQSVSPGIVALETISMANTKCPALIEAGDSKELEARMLADEDPGLFSMEKYLAALVNHRDLPHEVANVVAENQEVYQQMLKRRDNTFKKEG